MSSLRNFRRQIQKAADEKGQGNHHFLPVGQVVSPKPIKGPFLALPLFGWISRRATTDTPLVMMAALLIREAGESPQGTLQMEFPIFDHTEKETIAELERYGWDGRVWPRDEGWPTGTSDEENTKDLLEKANLKATFTFPSMDTGAAVQKVEVLRSQGPFLMPALAPVVEADEAKLENLRAIIKDANALFYGR